MVDLRVFAPNGIDGTRRIELKPVYEDGNPRTAFLGEMRQYGFETPELPLIGHLERMPAPGDKGRKKSGWYIYNEVADDYRPGSSIGIGVFGSWRGNPEKVVWTSKRKTSMSNAEQVRLNEQIEAAKILRDAETAARQAEAAAKAERIWSETGPAPADHPYFLGKGIAPHGTRISRGTIVVPVLFAGALASIQFIGQDGDKKFLGGGRTKGCWCKIQGEDCEAVYVAEGFATAATIAEATGRASYAAFNAGNLMDVANAVKDMHASARVVICGDDDRFTDGNPGRSKAAAAADVVHCRAVFPEFSDLSTKPTDFNDMARLEGIDAVRELLTVRPVIYVATGKYDGMPGHLLSPPGILFDIANFYNATARAPQSGFAVQTAIALGSVVLGRHFRTTKANHASLYLLNVAKSGTGKEHSKTVIEDILTAAGLEDIINGGGYTSAGAVFSTLLRKPRHITIIDEFGRYLEASNSQRNANLMEANTQLMEAVGRCHGTMRPTAYSTMTLTKEKADEFAARKIRNPAITLLAMTTPAALFKNLDSDSVADGFLGRFVVHQSNIPRMVHDDKDMIGVPRKIIDWVNAVTLRSGYNAKSGELASDEPPFVTVPFSAEALTILRDFDEKRVQICNELEQFGLEALPGRSKEMAMRLSLIVALAEDVHATVISQTHALWSVQYIGYALEQTIDSLKMRISGSDFEKHKKESLMAIRNAGEQGVTWTEMQKRPPFSKHRPRDLRDILSSLQDSGLMVLDRVHTGKRGRPREAYMAVQ